MTSGNQGASALQVRFATAVADLERRYAENAERMADDTQEEVVRAWLDADRTLPWAGTGVTADEWFFITTLYGEMTLDGQRTHIRRFFPLFGERTGGDMRRLTPEAMIDWKLRSTWMKGRLLRMTDLLREREQTMPEYADGLRALERGATPANPTPALDAIVVDHRATGWKTLRVFVRDCVGGNCFSIDSRVAKELGKHDLPVNERELVSLSLGAGRNPRQVARLFFAAGDG